MSDKTNMAVDSPGSGRTALLALDWGTSSLRAWRVTAAGRVLEERHRPWGILRLPDGGFPAAYASITEGWQGQPDAPVAAIASGMVGSRQGWQEVPYLSLPLDLNQLAGSLTQVGGTGLRLVPGLIDETRDGRPDVMRGEETEAVGALERLEDTAGEILLVMPGTHCKWVRVSNGVIAGFTTYMTGELFAMLTEHSILGRSIPTTAPTLPADDPARRRAFDDGVRAAASDGLAGRLFSVRALVLTGRLDAALITDYLSGLLIGEELTRALAAAHAGSAEPGRIVLVGDPAITTRYARAFATLGRTIPLELGAASVRGLYRIAVLAGLVSATAGDSAC